MTTGNSEVDALKLVQIETVKGRFGLGRTIVAREGFSQEVFRQGKHVASLSPSQPSLQVKDNDVILHVSLTTHLISINGELVTLDYRPTYRADIHFRISDPQYFAIDCFQQNDPILQMRIAVHNALQKHAATQKHATLDNDQLNYQVRSTTIKINPRESFGITASNVFVHLFMDAKLAQVHELQQQAALRESELQAQTHIKTKEIEHTTIVKETEIQARGKIQESEDIIQQERQRRLAEHRQNEERRQQQHETDLQVDQLTGQRKIDEIIHADEVYRMEHEWSIEDKQRNRTKLIAQEQAKLELETRKQLLLGEGDLESIGRQKQSQEQEYKRREEAKHKEFTRIEEVKQHEHEIAEGQRLQAYQRQQKLLNRVGDDAMDELGAYFKTEIHAGHTLEEILSGFPQLRDIFQMPGIAAHIEQLQTSITQESPTSTELEKSNGGPIHMFEPAFSELPPSKREQLPGLLTRMIEGFYVPRLGLTLIPAQLSASQCAQVGLDSDTIFIIRHLTNGGEAIRAGVMVGDKLFAINDTFLDSPRRLSDILQKCRAEETIMLHLLRGGKPLDRQIQLDQ